MVHYVGKKVATYSPKYAVLLLPLSPTAVVISVCCTTGVVLCKLKSAEKIFSFDLSFTWDLIVALEIPANHRSLTVPPCRLHLRPL